MNKTTTGWVVFLAAIGMMFGLLAVDIIALKEWADIYTTAFVGTFIGHISVTITAFIGGRLIPTAQEQARQTMAEVKAQGVEVKQ